MEIASYLKKPKWLFGCYPLQDQVNRLESAGVTHFINLTEGHEKKIKPYTVSSTSTLISFPIKDHNIPNDWGLFARFLLLLEHVSNTKEGKIFIHCRGGHGRAGMVTACLLCHLDGLSPQQALQETNIAHKRRPSLKEKWKKVGSPHLYRQRSFVFRFFEPLVLHRLKYKIDMGFSRFSQSPIKVNENIFQSVEGALLFRRHFSQSSVHDYKSLHGRDAYMIRKCSHQTQAEKGWDEEKEKILFQLYVLKFEQHPHELYNLLRTGMRPIILRAKGNYTWPNGSGTNVAGETLQKIRKFYYTKKLNWPIINGLPSTVKDSVLREPSSTVLREPSSTVGATTCKNEKGCIKRDED